MEPITDVELTAAQALCDAATKGPWCTGLAGDYWPIAARIDGRWVDLLCSANRENDAALMVASRMLIPCLLAEIARLRLSIVPGPGPALDWRAAHCDVQNRYEIMREGLEPDAEEDA